MPSIEKSKMAFDEFVDNFFVELLFHYGDYGELPDCSTLPESVQTVFLVYQTMGLIGNGGFPSLLSDDYDGDPNYQLTFKAFERIGASGAVKAINHMLGLYEGNELPADPETRIEIWNRHFDRTDTSSPTFEFFDASTETLSKLKTYIETNFEFQNDQ